jgi:hypothetical protein
MKTLLRSREIKFYFCFFPYVAQEKLENQVIKKVWPKVPVIFLNHFFPSFLFCCMFQECEANIRVLATDHHLGIAKQMRESDPEINPQFDLWHIVKGLRKKLSNSKQKDLQPWISAVANHLWYCADTCDGDADLLIEKWLSVLHHVTNQHDWITGDKFHKCEHEPYDRRDVKSTLWLQSGSDAHLVPQKAVCITMPDSPARGYHSDICTVHA